MVQKIQGKNFHTKFRKNPFGRFRVVIRICVRTAKRGDFNALREYIGAYDVLSFEGSSRN